jgi:hypothetical protein
MTRPDEQPANDADDWHLEGEGPTPIVRSEAERAADADARVAEAASRACPRCGEEMHSIGVVDFRTGGTEGKWHVLAGEWAELGEGLLPLELRYCPKCREVSMRMP